MPFISNGPLLIQANCPHFLYRLAMIKNEKKAKEREKKEIEAMNRKHLSNMRVVQKSLVYVIGLPAKLANDEVSGQTQWFDGQWTVDIKPVFLN